MSEMQQGEQLIVIVEKVWYCAKLLANAKGGRGKAGWKVTCIAELGRVLELLKEMEAKQ
jgi:hypothetical protein